MDVAILATARERTGQRVDVRSAPTALAVRDIAATDGTSMIGVKGSDLLAGDTAAVVVEGKTGTWVTARFLSEGSSEPLASAPARPTEAAAQAFNHDD